MRKLPKIWPGSPNTRRLVSITSDHTLRSRMRLTSHVRFWIGGGGSNPVADHTLLVTEKREFQARFTKPTLSQRDSILASAMPARAQSPSPLMHGEHGFCNCMRTSNGPGPTHWQGKPRKPHRAFYCDKRASSRPISSSREVMTVHCRPMPKRSLSKYSQSLAHESL